MGNLDTAKEKMDAAIKINPEIAAFYYNRGKIHSDMGKSQDKDRANQSYQCAENDAEMAISKAAKDDPIHAFYDHLGYILLRRSSLEADPSIALARLRKAQENVGRAISSVTESNPQHATYIEHQNRIDHEIARRQEKSPLGKRQRSGEPVSPQSLSAMSAAPVGERLPSPKTDTGDSAPRPLNPPTIAI